MAMMRRAGPDGALVHRPAPAPGAPSRNRLEWVDAGRGVAILLVVLYHASNWLAEAKLHVAYWQEINDVLATMRMPLFFTLSGLFASKWLTASWAALWNVKLRLLVWVFLLWEVIGTVVTYGALTLQGREFGLLHEARKLALSPLAPQLELWFLWVLALYFVVCKAIRRVDVRVQLGVAGVLSAVALSVDFELVPWTVNIGWSGALKYILFFLAGIHLRSWILAYAQRPARVHVTVFAVWALVATGVDVLELRFVPVVYVLNCLLGVLAGVALSRGLAGVAVLRRLGANTLPIYLAHTPLVIMVTTLVVLVGAAEELDVVHPVVPLALTAVAAASSLWLHRAASRGRGRWLYEPPADLLVRPS